MNSAAFSDYSRAKAMREVKALKLLQLFESGKMADMVDDNIDHEWEVFNNTQFVADVEDYLNVV